MRVYVSRAWAHPFPARRLFFQFGHSALHIVHSILEFENDFFLILLGSLPLKEG
jgi:hypothetical protein